MLPKDIESAFDTTDLDNQITSLETKYKEYFVEANKQINEFNNQTLELQGNQSNLQANFLNPEINPVVRAFESNMGRGLAGFIKSLNVDYNGANWRTNTSDWNTIASTAAGVTKDLNDKSHLSVAPMRVKVSMSFAPIHDMPLGLDYKGTIFAPTHPVGKWSASQVDETLAESIAKANSQG